MIEAPSLETITRWHNVPFPNPIPYIDITCGMVLWNEAHRLPALLDTLQPVFEHIAIVVQKSTDDTLEIAEQRARDGDLVLEDKHHGHGDASMPKLLAAIRTPWTFIVAGDEMPNERLLRSIWSAGWWAEDRGIDGLWVDFESTIEGIRANEQVSHLRMFRRSLTWSPTMHSRVYPIREGHWPTGVIRHDRSLDEMVRDYLRYFELGRGNTGWETHNRTMIHDAVAAVAETRGWGFVREFEWWPEVRAICFPKEG